MNRLYNLVRRQKLKYFGQVTRHNGLDEAIMQGMVAGKRSRGTMKTASRVAKDRHRFRKNNGQRRPKEDMLSEEEYWKL